jgi:hypothetical protein
VDLRLRLLDRLDGLLSRLEQQSAEAGIDTERQRRDCERASRRSVAVRFFECVEHRCPFLGRWKDDRGADTLQAPCGFVSKAG